MNKKKDELEECAFVEVHPDIVKKAEENKIEEATFQDLSLFFKIYGDPTRLKILNLLFHQELCVCDISYLLKMSHSAVSHQLSVLRQSRIIKNRRNGKNVIYSLDDEHIKLIFDAGLSHILEKR